MRAVARYDFERKKTAPSRYVLKSHEGEEIPNILAEYKDGERYIEFLTNEQGSRYYRFGFYVGNMGGRHKRLTGVNFTPQESRRTFGDDRSIGRSDCLLFEFSDDRERLSLWVIAKKTDSARSVFNHWTLGDSISLKRKTA